MAVILNRRGNPKAGEGNKQNIRRSTDKAIRKMRVKTHPDMRKRMKEVADSIEKAKTPEKVVVIKTPRNVPRSANAQTKAFLKKEPKNTNPETNRKRNWKYEKYPPILPPIIYIRKVARSPHPKLVGRITETKGA